MDLSLPSDFCTNDFPDFPWCYKSRNFVFVRSQYSDNERIVIKLCVKSFLKYRLYVIVSAK